MPARVRGVCACFYIVCMTFPSLTVPLFAAGPNVQRTGSLAVVGASDEIKKAVEDKGYRVSLNDGWVAEFWFARALITSNNDAAAGALYPQLSNGEFVGAVSFTKGSSDYRGQAIPPGAYSLRYQYLPQDANHMGVSPNPDFLLAIPVASDSNPSELLALKRLISLSAKTTGTSHPAVIAMAPAAAPASIAKDDQGMTVLTIEVPTTASGKTVTLGIVLKGQATQ